MRKTKTLQLQLGEVAIENIQFDPRSRDDIPAILLGLQYIYTNPQTQKELFSILETHFLPGVNLKVGRPGMDLWRVLVLGILKQGLGCDFDRLGELANHHDTVREMLCHSDFREKQLYNQQTIIDNVSLLSPELLSEIGKLVVSSGHKVSKKKPGERLRTRVDSFVVETDVSYPTDVKLLWDAVRCMVKQTAAVAQEYETGGWRQQHYLLRQVKNLFNSVRKSRGGKRSLKKVEAYLCLCSGLVMRSEQTLVELLRVEAPESQLKVIRSFITHAKRQIDQTDRRLLKKEAIPHKEKVFSVFEPHTRWISKGKAGCPVELGVPVCIMEDQYQFILNHRIMWEEGDVDVAVEFVKDTREKYPDVCVCSFDRGFHSQQNRSELDRVLELSALPKKGKLNSADKEREDAQGFAEARKQHPAVESAINSLEHKGLSRVRTHGRSGFERTVALSLLAANIHRLGAVLRKAEQKRRRRQATKLAA